MLACAMNRLEAAVVPRRPQRKHGCVQIQTFEHTIPSLQMAEVVAHSNGPLVHVARNLTTSSAPDLGNQPDLWPHLSHEEALAGLNVLQLG